MPSRPDDLPIAISLRNVNGVVGLIALGLPFALMAVAKLTGGCVQDSISHNYYAAIGGDVFTGALILIGTILLLFFHPAAPRPDGYRTFTKWHWHALRLAGLAALVIAFAPTSDPGCPVTAAPPRVFVDAAGGPSYDLWAAFGIENTLVRNLHNIGAAVMFLILGIFSTFVFTRVQSHRSLRSGAEPKPERLTFVWSGKHTTKKVRNTIYVLCGLAIFAAILGLAVNKFWCQPDTVCRAKWNSADATYWLEAVALWAFGFSWLVKGRFIPWLNDPE
ncbi:hypothetical protein [Shimia biformata]|uniref:hypothetical protein n=1 Tax=Shimia biformata TaxID=1294299 RepID=UPI00194FC25C|nr:hypothetical protein [Shimia biformata]